MSTESPYELYKKYSKAIAYVAVEKPDGGQGIGTAFHVGEGSFVTARHVVEGNKILEIGIDQGFHSDILVISKGPFFAAGDVDIAVFKVANMSSHAPAVPLGSHLDDWLGVDDFVLSDVIIMGYPPIPFSRQPHLVTARGEVNAQVGLWHAKHPHFIISSTPRGGFSGGVAISEGGFALGVITQSLLVNDLPEQLGYMAVLSIEPIYATLGLHRILPSDQADGWHDIWSSQSDDYEIAVQQGYCTPVSVDTLDDGKQCAFSISTDDVDLRNQLMAIAKRAFCDFEIQEVFLDKVSRIIITDNLAETPSLLLKLRGDCKEYLLDNGYLPAHHPDIQRDYSDVPF